MRVLMVCLGNICRSPLAEGILRAKVKDLNLDWTIDSAGTSNYHVGDMPHRESIAIAKAHGINIMGQKSREFLAIDFDRFDLIIAMDSSNYQDMLRLSDNPKDKEKVKLLLNYLYPSMNKAVPDPYYEGGFPAVYDEIEKAIEALITSTTQNANNSNHYDRRK